MPEHSERVRRMYEKKTVKRIYSKAEVACIWNMGLTREYDKNLTDEEWNEQFEQDLKTLEK